MKQEWKQGHLPAYPGSRSHSKILLILEPIVTIQSVFQFLPLFLKEF